MNTALSTLRERIKNGYDYIVYPNAMGDMPITLKKMEKIDATGKVIGHYSINELSTLFGDDFTPVQYINTKFMLIHWSFDEIIDVTSGVSERQLTKDLLKSKGLVDMRVGYPDAKSIDYGSLKGNEFGFFGAYEMRYVPKYVVQNNKTGSTATKQTATKQTATKGVI
jgi:hypothetical protein